MTTPYTLKRLTEVEDSAPKFGMGEIAEARFCSGDLRRQRRLRDADRGGGAAKVRVVGDRDEALELADRRAPQTTAGNTLHDRFCLSRIGV